MKALITGASSGIGKEMAKYLASKNIDLILIARRIERLEELKKELNNVNVSIMSADLNNIDDVYKIYNEYSKDNIDILINNAGFGLFGNFYETDLNRELEMINVNLVAPHILTKLFLKDFINKNNGYILNVCSSAGFMAGPKLSTYYSTKNYMLKLSMAIYEELRSINSKVSISALCPGPVDTEFNDVAKGKFTIKGCKSDYVAKYAIDNMFKRKLFIIPKFSIKASIFSMRFIPYKLQLRVIHNIQNNKIKEFQK